MRGDACYPEALTVVSHPPQCLYLIGDPDALQEGLAVVGARKATPYGLSCARHFAGIAAERGIVVVSGGARGCDAAAHEAALAAHGKTVAFLGGGCDEIYPAENASLFQRIIDTGGAVVSEREWGFEPLPFTFRERNRLIAGLARATLIVEAGLPSGTFSTADAALEANRDVLVVPGAITSSCSRGANRLIYQGAVPVVDDETFADQLNGLFGCPGTLPLEYDVVGSSRGEGVAATGGDAEGSAAGGTADAAAVGRAPDSHSVGGAAVTGSTGAVADADVIGASAAECALDADAVGVAGTGGSRVANPELPGGRGTQGFVDGGRALLEALQAAPLDIDELCDVAAGYVRRGDPRAAVMMWLAEAVRAGKITQYPDGRFGSILNS